MHSFNGFFFHYTVRPGEKKTFEWRVKREAAAHTLRHPNDYKVRVWSRIFVILDK